MPGRGSVWETVFDDQPDGHADYPVSVMALGQGKIAHGRVEVLVASTTIVLGVGDLDIPRPIDRGIAEIMDGPHNGSDAIRAVLAVRAAAVLVVPAALGDFGFRQIFNADDSLGDIRDVLTRACHDEVLHDHIQIGSVPGFVDQLGPNS